MVTRKHGRPWPKCNQCSTSLKAGPLKGKRSSREGNATLDDGSRVNEWTDGWMLRRIPISLSLSRGCLRLRRTSLAHARLVPSTRLCSPKLRAPAQTITTTMSTTCPVPLKPPFFLQEPQKLVGFHRNPSIFTICRAYPMIFQLASSAFTHSRIHSFTRSQHTHMDIALRVRTCMHVMTMDLRLQRSRTRRSPFSRRHAWPTWRKLLRSRLFMTRRRTHCAALRCTALHCTRRSRSPLAALPPPLEIGAGSKIWYELLSCDLRAMKKTAHK